MSEKTAAAESASTYPRPGASAELRRLWEVRLLPRAVAWFYLRAVTSARRLDDATTLASALSPRDLAKLLEVANEHEHIVELGTGSAWTAIALALADERRRVTTFDQKIRAHRARYLDLVRGSVRDRIDFRPEPIERAPDVLGDQRDFVSISSFGDPEQTIASYASADKLVRPGGLVVFLPYGEAREGVGELTREVLSDGSLDGGVFVWRKPRIEEPSAKRRTRIGSIGRGGAIVLVGLALGAAVGALVTLTDNGDQAPSRSLERRPAPQTRVPTVASPNRAGGERSRRSSSRAARRSRSGRGNGAAVRTISGRGTRSIGTLHVNEATAMSWRTQGSRLTVSSRGTRLNLPAEEGYTLLSPGSYPRVTVRSSGKWTVSLRPR